MRFKPLLLTIAFVASILSPIAVFARPAAAQAIDNDPDCDKYSVIWCGGFTMNKIQEKYANGDGHNTANNIQGIFSELGISKAEVNANGFVTGVVYQNGNIKVNDKVVAKNAKTYIRHLGGKVDVSKMASAQTAFVMLNADGQFMYAIMKPCGNPVKAENVVPKPDNQVLKCEVLNVTKGDNRTVNATLVGSASGGAKITGYTIDFNDGYVAKKNTASHTYAADGKYTIVGHVQGKVDGNDKNKTSADCTKVVEFSPIPPQPKPQSLTCTIITPVVNNKTVTTTIQASAVNGATITGYTTDFGDGSAAVAGQTASHTYTKDGKWQITGYVIGTVDGHPTTVSSVPCTTVVPINTQMLTCTTMSKVLGDNRTVTTEIQASAVNGATITGYSTNFGDKTDAVPGQVATHTYATTSGDGPFIIVGSVTGMVNGQKVTVSSKECTRQVQYEKNTPVCPTNPSLPVDDKNCKETTPTTTPETIPATGPEGMMSIFAATTALGTYGHRKWSLRRNKQ